MNFGLGLILSFTNNASAGINSAVQSLGTLTSTAEKSSQAINDLADTAVLGSLSVVAGHLGDTFIGMGNSIIGVFKNLLKGTVDTGSQFESLRITVGALLKDTGKAQTAVQNLMNFSARTPFEINDLTGMFTTITANGLDAFKKLSSAKTGFQQELLGFIGDLMAFRPDVPAIQWATAIRNAFSGEVRSLKNALDVNVVDILGRKWGKTADQVAQDFADLADNLGVAGLMMKNMGTWKQILSNVSDQFTRLFLAIADAGVFNDLKKALQGITDSLFELNASDVQGIAKTIADSMSFIVKPIVKLGQTVGTLIRAVTKLATTQPKIAKFILQLVALTGALLIFTGVTLKVISSLSGLAIIFLAMGGSFAKVQAILIRGISTLVSTIAPLLLLIGALYLAWKYDFAGIRTLITGFVSHTLDSFSKAQNAVNGSVGNMIATMAELNKSGSFWDNVTIGIMKLMVVLKGLKDAWGDYTLSSDTFLKAKELGVLPLIEAVLDLKYRFELFRDGFIAGFKEIGNKVKEFFSGISNSAKGTFLSSAIDDITTFLQKLSGGDAKAWYKFGESFGKFTAKAIIFFATFKVIGGIVGKLATLLTAISNISKVFGILGNGVSLVAKMLLGVLKFAGNFTKLFGAIANIFNIAKTAVVGLLTMLGTAVTFVLGLFGVMVTLPAWLVGLITVALIAVVALVVKYRDKIWGAIKTLGGWIRDFFKGILDSKALEPIKASILSIGAWFKKAFDKVSEVFKKIKDSVGGVIGKIKDDMKALGSQIMEYLTPAIENFNKLKSTFKEFVGFIGGKLKELIGVIAPVLSEMKSIAVSIFNSIVSEIKKIWDSLWSVIGPVVTGLFHLVVGVLGSLLKGVIGIALAIFNTIKGAFLAILKTVGGVLKALYDTAVGILSSIIDFIGGILSGIWEIISNVLMGIMNFIMGKNDEAKANFVAVWNAIKATIFSVVKAIFKFTSSIFNGIKNVIKSVLDGISGIVSSVFGGIKDTFVSIGGAIGGVVSSVFNGIKETITGVMSGIKNAVSDGLDKVKSFFKGLKLELPKIKLPHFKLSGSFSLKPPSVPKIGIDWYAKGGVFNKPSVIGVGEQGKEAVMPLEKNTGWISILASKIGSLMSTNTSTNNAVLGDIAESFVKALYSISSSLIGGSIINPVSPMSDNGDVKPVPSINNTSSDSLNNHYLTTNNVNNTTNSEKQGNVDNSVTFENGAIQVTVQKASEEEAEKFARMIMDKIKRLKDIEDLRNYRDLVQTQ